jgi:hypothetical protein
MKSFLSFLARLGAGLNRLIIGILLIAVYLVCVGIGRLLYAFARPRKQSQSYWQTPSGGTVYDPLSGY